MDWIERLNEAIRYIEENLTGEIEYPMNDFVDIRFVVIY